MNAGCWAVLVDVGSASMTTCHPAAPASGQNSNHEYWAVSVAFQGWCLG